MSRFSTWDGFPIDASPRPVILIGSRVQMTGSFVSVDAKRAVARGAVDSDLALPGGVLDLIRGEGLDGTVAPQRITSIESVSWSFLCDRGPRELPAYRMTFAGLNGHVTVLDPEVECWWPQAGESGSPFLSEAEIGRDDRTIHFPAFGGLMTEFVRAEFAENETYVIGRAVTEQRRSAGPVAAVGVQRPVTDVLTKPLGDRVLVNEDGRPLAVTPTK